MVHGATTVCIMHAVVHAQRMVQGMMQVQLLVTQGVNAHMQGITNPLRMHVGTPPPPRTCQTPPYP